VFLLDRRRNGDLSFRSGRQLNTTGAFSLDRRRYGDLLLDSRRQLSTTQVITEVATASLPVPCRPYSQWQLLLRFFRRGSGGSAGVLYGQTVRGGGGGNGGVHYGQIVRGGGGGNSGPELAVLSQANLRVP
jgi:hypothetical protein